MAALVAGVAIPTVDGHPGGTAALVAGVARRHPGREGVEVVAVAGYPGGVAALSPSDKLVISFSTVSSSDCASKDCFNARVFLLTESDVIAAWLSFGRGEEF